MSATCGHAIPVDNDGWWTIFVPCSKKPHESGKHIGEFRSFGGAERWAIWTPGEQFATVYGRTKRRG
jgi:hypothetical protein